MKKTEKIYVSIIIAILLIIIGIIYLYPPIIRHVKCPDYWTQNRSGEFFVKNEQKINPSYEYLQWVKSNCNIKPTKISEIGF